MMLRIDAMLDPRLRPVAEKALAGEPASTEDARAMLETDDIVGLGAIANHHRRRLHGDRAYYGVNMNLNYTNVCELRCPLCAYSKDAGDEGAYRYTLDEIESRVRDAAERGIDEVHIVGGLHPELKLEYFEEMLRRIKRIRRELFIVAFTAVEYDYFARINGLALEEVFRRLIDAGLGALPGGGAEIFAPETRRVIAPKKMSGERWLEVMETAHRMGLKTNATMLYNHIETTDQIVDHLTRIRALQEKTAGFKTFVPLPFHAENTAVRTARPPRTGFGDVRIYATARVFLHTVPHLKALWMYLGERLAQTMLAFGADDIGATYHHERVVHAAGATSAASGSEARLRRLIERAGFVPVRANAAYETIDPEARA
ncbi:MAG TPA: CofH family radical SAM protein [Spirochaetota bacterium]|nr:CofH family radical SAM protein [Spirochaetota bacterium]HNT12705.1 CofH family radical SAM protein [Spirochaetota bacterium]